MAPRGPFAAPLGVRSEEAPRRLQFMPSSRKGSDAGSSGSGGQGGTGFCDPEAFSGSPAPRTHISGLHDQYAMEARKLQEESADSPLNFKEMETTLMSPTDTCASTRTRSETGESKSSAKTTPKINAFQRNNTVGNLEGYHGVRVQRHATNKRLFGLGPCQRSSVDEVVYGRDMDGSLGDNSNAEIDVLLNMFEGAAGKKYAIAELLEDVPGKGLRGPDDDKKLCLRSAERIAEQGFEECAGKQTREPRDMKRAWRRLPMQKSSVAEIVFGQDHNHLSGHEQLFISQFSRSAGYSPRIKKGREDGKAAHPTPGAGTPSKRRFFLSSAINGSMGGIHAPLEQLEKAHQKHRETGKLGDLADLFHGAAGKSPRYEMDAAGRARQKSTVHPVYCVYS